MKDRTRLPARHKEARFIHIDAFDKIHKQTKIAIQPKIKKKKQGYQHSKKKQDMNQNQKGRTNITLQVFNRILGDLQTLPARHLVRV